MTDRINSVVVTFEEDIRVDDAEAIISAIEMIKGVISVKGNVSDIQSHVAYTKARTDLMSKLFDVLK